MEELSVEKIKCFLETTGWEEDTNNSNPNISVFTYEDIILDVPRNKTARDYEQRIEGTIISLADILEIPTDALIQNINESNEKGLTNGLVGDRQNYCRC